MTNWRSNKGKRREDLPDPATGSAASHDQEAAGMVSARRGGIAGGGFLMALKVASRAVVRYTKLRRRLGGKV